MIASRAIAAALTLCVLVPWSARAEAPGTPAYRAAEDAVRGFREQGYLPTSCERAFRKFWLSYTKDVDRGVLYSRSAFGGMTYFGLGNRAAEPLLQEAVGICQEQAGHPGDIIVRVMRDRQRHKDWFNKRSQHAERLTDGKW